MANSTKLIIFISSVAILLSAAYLPVINESFQGNIRYTKISLTDTVVLDYFIKNKKVRIERKKTDGKLLEISIIDFIEKRITILNPKEKLYVFKAIDVEKDKSTSGVQVQKTGNFKYIQGYKCFQWLVRNKTDNAVVTFWVADEHYELYDDLLKSLSETEKISDYYTYISDTNGYIPLQSVENSWLRDTRMTLTADKIIRKDLPEDLFDIPKGYQAFE